MGTNHMIRTRHARRIRAGIAAAHLPHRLRELWLMGTSDVLAITAYMRTVQGDAIRMLERFTKTINDGRSS